MRASPLTPKRHLFVCVNRRPEGDPLGPGCSGAGDEVYRALKAEVGARGLAARVWITRAMCLGLCPKHGTTVACYPAVSGQASLLTEVSTDDMPQLRNLFEYTP